MINKINLTPYPIGNMQTVYTSEGNTALELAGITAKKVNECVEIVNGVDEIATQAQQVVFEMRNEQAEIVATLKDQVIPATTEDYIDLKLSDGTIGSLINTELLGAINAKDLEQDSDIAGLDVRLDTAEQGLINHGTSLTDLDARLDTAEGTLTTHGTSLTELDTRLDTAEQTITNHGTSLTELDGRLDTAEQTLTSLDGRLDTAEEDITELAGLIADIKPSVSKSTFSVENFGASGNALNGVNDTQAFINTKNALSNNGGGVFYVPKGLYLLTQVIDFLNVDVCIEGEGEQNTIIFFDHCNGIKYTSTDPFTNQISIRGITIVALSHYQYTGIEVQFPTNVGSTWVNCIIDEVSISGSLSVADYMTNAGVSSINNFATDILLNNCSGSKIKNNTLRNGTGIKTERGIGISLLGYCVDITIRHNKFYSQLYSISKAGPSEGIKIESNDFINVYNAVIFNNGYNTQAGVYATITNNLFTYFSTGIAILYHPQVKIEGNMFYSNNDLTGGYDIALNNSGRSKIHNNTMIVKGGSQFADGVIVSGSDIVEITDNIIEERSNGIWLKADATNVDLANNRLNNVNNMLIQTTSYKTQRTVYTFNGNYAVPSGAGSYITVDIPANYFKNKPVVGFCSGISSQFLQGYYSYDDPACDSTHARFYIKTAGGLAPNAETLRMNIYLSD